MSAPWKGSEVEAIGRFTLKREFTTLGGGQSEWTIAATGDGAEHFLKRYIQPVSPDPSLGLSEPTMQRLRDRVEYFRARQQSIIGRLNEEQFRRGVVGCTEFFEHERRFYKATPLVDPIDPVLLVDCLPPDAASVLFASADALDYLHARSVVHGDVKPENVLMSRSESGALNAHVIDLDEAYVEGYAPSREEIVGTIGYYSPELAAFVSARADRDALTRASGVFSLALTWVEMLTGRVPGFDRRHFRTTSQAVENGATIELDCCGQALTPLLADMLELAPYERPSASEVLDRVGILDVETLLDGASRAVGPNPEPGIPDHTAPDLMINLGRQTIGGR